MVIVQQRIGQRNIATDDGSIAGGAIETSPCTAQRSQPRPGQASPGTEKGTSMNYIQNGRENLCGDDEVDDGFDGSCH